MFDCDSSSKPEQIKNYYQQSQNVLGQNSHENEIEIENADDTLMNPYNIQT